MHIQIFCVVLTLNYVKSQSANRIIEQPAASRRQSAAKGLPLIFSQLIPKVEVEAKAEVGA